MTEFDGYADGTARMCPFCGQDVALVNGLTGPHAAPDEGWYGVPDRPVALCPGSGQYPRNAESDGRRLWNGQRNPRAGRADKPHKATDDDVLVIDVRRQFGRVCCKSTRVPYDSVAGPIFAGDSLESTAEDYGVTRKTALLCCWYMTEQARLAKRPTKLDREVVSRWGDWAEKAFSILAGWDTDTGPCPDPPTI